jgi:hypothetical protein
VVFLPIEVAAGGRVEKATGTTATSKRLVRFFMEFRRLAAMEDRRQKPIVCPTFSAALDVESLLPLDHKHDKRARFWACPLPGCRCRHLCRR